MTTLIKRISCLIILMGLAASFWGQSRLAYVENRGQWPDQVAGRIQVGSSTIYVEDGGLTYSIIDPEWAQAQHPGMGGTDLPYRAHAFRMNLEGAGTPEREQVGTLPEYHNYFLGSDSTKWASRCALSERLHLKEVYDGIDLQYHTRRNSVKYDFKVRPGGDPASIAWTYEGLDGIDMHEGTLVLKTAVMDVVESEPYAFQFIDGRLIEVACDYVLENGRVHFELGEYDPMYTLTIDPELVFSTFIGAGADNFGFTAANDSQGQAIAGAIVFGNGYPTELGAVQENINSSLTNSYDAAISKFNEDGSQLLYSTFLGGDRPDMPHSIVCDSEDNWIVMGTTGSFDFPTTAAAYQATHNGGVTINYASLYFSSSLSDAGVDFFLSKFSEDGTGFLGSTYVGGSGNDGLNGGVELLYNYGDGFRGEVNVDSQDRILVCSTTQSGDFPMPAPTPYSTFQGGGYDGIVYRMDSDLQDMDWACYLGGSADDAGYAVLTDETDHVMVTGGTLSTNFPIPASGHQTSKAGGVDGYVLKFSADGSSVESGTYVGTSEYDQCYFIQTNADQEIFVLGQTDGSMPLSAGVYGNADSGQFIRKYSEDLSSLEWSTTVGSSSGAIDISPTAFLVSDCDQIYFSGWGGLTNSLYSPYATFSSTSGMPVSADATQPDTDGSDFYLCVLSEEATDLVFATFLGGGVSNEHVDGGTARFDKSGSVYQAVCAGCGGSSDFPTSTDAYSGINGSSNCNLAVFKFDLGKIEAEIDIDGPVEICEGTPAQFINNSTGGNDYTWTFGDGSGTSDAFEPVYTYESNGEFEIQLLVEDAFGCLDPDSATITIQVIPGVNPSADEPEPICAGGTAQLQAYGSDNLYWIDDPTLSDTDIANPTATPPEPTTYFVVDFNDCEADTVAVEVTFVAINTSAGDDTTICIGDSAPIFADGAVSYSWSPEESVDNAASASTTATPSETTWYYVDMVTAEGCASLDSVLIEVDTDIPGGDVYDPLSLCEGDNVILDAEDGIAWTWTPDQFLSNASIQNPSASPTDTITYFVEIFNACGSGVSEVTVNVIQPFVEAGPDGLICLGEWHTAWATDAESWSWSPPQFTSGADQQQVSVSPPSSQTFTVTATDEYGCTATDDIYVEVLPLPEVNIGDPGAVNWLSSVTLQGYSSTEDFWWTPAELLSCGDCLNPEIYPDESVWIYLEAIDENGCIGRDSLLIDLVFPIYVPNAFTPDNDGINDVFFASGEGITGFEMRIVDRWGNLVFESNDISQVWDGSFQGGSHYVQNDVYIWTIWYEAPAGRVKLEGHVTLVR